MAQRLLLCAPVLLASLLAPGVVAAQSPPPPMAKEVTVRVERGRRVTIPLEASGRTPGNVRFLIRSQPEHGTLGEIERLSGTAASLTYQHNGQRGHTADEFRFATQAVDSPVSASAKVIILIGEPPVRPELPKTLGFPDTEVGATSQASLFIGNSQGGDGTIQLAVDPPWRVEPQGKILMTAGKSARVQVFFSPTAPVTFEGRLGVPNFPGTALLGRGIESLLIPDSMEFDNARKATLTLRNKGSRSRTLAFSLPEGINGPETAVIPADKSVTVGFSASQPGAMQGEIQLADPILQRTVRFDCPALPARLDIPEALDFGNIPQAGDSKRSFEVHNTGGTSAQLSSRSRALIVPDPATVVIPPGGKHRFEVILSDLPVGPHTSEIVLGTAGISHTLRVTAQVIAQEPATRPTLIVPPPPTENPHGDTPRAPQAEGPSGFQLLPSKPGSLRLTWKDTLGADHFVIQRRELETENDNVVIKWLPWKGEIFSRNGDQITLTLTHLPHNAAWFVRILGVSGDAHLFPPSDTLRIATPPTPAHPWIPWTLGILATLTVAGTLAKLFQIQRHQRAEEDAARITRLGGS